MNSRYITLWVFSVLLANAPNAQADQWSASRGGPQRLGVRSGVGELEQPQAKWKMHLGGKLSSKSMWVLGQNDPAVIIAAGGRITAKAWDDVVYWKSELLQANQILTVIDVDQDGVDDTIVANRNGAAGTLTLLNMDGTVRWIAPTELGPLHNGVRIADIDADGHLDLLTFPYKSGAGIHAFSLWPITAPPTLSWHASRDNRDYKAGFFDLIGEFDGSPGLEIVSVGHRYLYMHDAATGVLEQTSPMQEVLPYGRATLKAADVDGDGVSELFAFSNQNWAAPSNRRHVSMYSWNNQSFSERWSLTLEDSQNDRLRFTDQSVIDVDQDGQLEVVVSTYDNGTQAWTLKILDAQTGVTLSALPGYRLSEIFSVQGTTYISTQDDGPLTLFRFERGSPLEEVFTTPNLKVATCRTQSPLLTGPPESSPCTLASEDIVLYSLNANNERRSISLLSTISAQPSQVYVSESGTIVGYWTTVGDTETAIAVATSDGKIQPLNKQLQIPSPIVAVPYSWSGIFFGSAIQSTNFAKFPFSFSAATGENEDLLIIRGDKEVVAISPFQEASIIGGVKELWSHPKGDYLSLAVSPENTKVLIFDEQDGISAVSTKTGQVDWSISNLFDRLDGLTLHQAPIQAGSETWFHRINSGTYDLVSVANIDGEITNSSSLDSNTGGWRRLTKISNEENEKVISSGKVREIWTFDPQGNPTKIPSEKAAIMILDINNGWLQISSSFIEKKGYDGTVIWSTPMSNDRTKLGTVLTSQGTQRYITSLGYSNEVAAFDTETGALSWSTYLSNGQKIDTKTLGATVFANVSGIHQLSSETGAAVFVGGSDGFLYALDAADGSLLWSLDLESPVGEVITADWDGDGVLELSVVTEDGNVVGIDSYTVASPRHCIDIDPANLSSLVDIDRLVSTDQLAASWDTVSDAVSYELAIFTISGELLRDFQDVGNTSAAVVTGLNLVSDTRYRIAVRAVYADGQRSVDVGSDGVTVIFEEEPEGENIDPGTPVGCGCSTGSKSDGIPWLVSILLLLLFARRKETNSFDL